MLTDAPSPLSGTYSRPLGMAVQAPAAETSLTPENELKWAIVHPEPNRYDFCPADDLVDLARRTGKRGAEPALQAVRTALAGGCLRLKRNLTSTSALVLQ